jgi:alkanesulfonate monooxygenase SsuD/methylene tetrahydromethanopterin reductase-like flavin-dependent oxidoreductase (luciferase family)
MPTNAPPLAVSVLYPMQPLRADAVAPFARAVIDTGARRLWLGQSMVAESHQVLAYLAGMGIRLPVGLGVTLTPLRHPFEAALQARSLALLTGHPVVAGYGPATPAFVAGLCGAPYREPVSVAAGYASAVRRLVGGAPGPSRIELPAVAHPTVEVGLGVLRPVMARAAGAVADAAITWMTPPEYVRDQLAPALADGATDRPRPPRIVTMVHVGVARRARDPYRMALAAAGGHLCAPHYSDMLRRAGIPIDPSDPAGGARALVDAGVYAYGTPDEIAERVRGYRDAGVDEVVLNTAGVAFTDGVDAALADLAEISAAIRDDHIGHSHAAGVPAGERTTSP